MIVSGVKKLQLLLLGLLVLFSTNLSAQEETNKTAEQKGSFNAQEVIFGHILDNHEYHFTGYTDAQGKEHSISIPLPVIVYSKEKGLSAFSSSRFEEGAAVYNGYKLNENGKIVAVKEDGTVDDAVKVYDFSITRNVAQMILALTVLTWLMLSVANTYKKGIGVVSAPKGKQSLLETVIIFVRDEIAKPCLGHRYEKYLPYILTLFFFILINNLFGLIPGTANVSGNIAFTGVLGIISFVVILFSSDSHYWLDIINPPGVPFLVKFILVPIEIASLFIKPFALIIRLFANMVAGHIIIISLISLIFILGGASKTTGWSTAPFSVAFTVFIYFIEILVAFIQAFIFAMLTAVFIGQAFEGSEKHYMEEHKKEEVAAV
jgi:F-type H+-transporting ATPase subunit a